MENLQNKSVEYNGAKYVIGELTEGQCEDLFGAPGTEKKAGYTEIICASLNNALPEGSPEEAKWDEARVKKSMGKGTKELLVKDIFEMSGLIFEKAQPGKEPAAN